MSLLGNRRGGLKGLISEGFQDKKGGTSMGSQSMGSVYNNESKSLLDYAPSVPEPDFSGFKDYLSRDTPKRTRTVEDSGDMSDIYGGSGNSGFSYSAPEFDIDVNSTVENAWNSVRDSKPSVDFEMPEINNPFKVPDRFKERTPYEDQNLLEDRAVQTGLGVGGGYLLLNDAFTYMSGLEGKMGEVGAEALDYTKNVVYNDFQDISEMDSLLDTAMATSDNLVHGVANYGIAKAGCRAVDKFTDEHDPKKTALGGLAAVAGFTLFKEGYLQNGSFTDLGLESLDTQGDIIMNTAGGLYGIYEHEKNMASNGDVESESRLQEGLNDMAYKAGRAYGAIIDDTNGLLNEDALVNGSGTVDRI